MKNFSVKVNGKIYDCEVEEVNEVWKRRDGIHAPLSGRISKVWKQAGDYVKKGDRIMEIKTITEITAPYSGKVTMVFEENEDINKEDLLAFIKRIP